MSLNCRCSNKQKTNKHKSSIFFPPLPYVSLFVCSFLWKRKSLLTVNRDDWPVTALTGVRRHFKEHLGNSVLFISLQWEELQVLFCEVWKVWGVSIRCINRMWLILHQCTDNVQSEYQLRKLQALEQKITCLKKITRKCLWHFVKCAEYNRTLTNSSLHKEHCRCQ